MNNMQFGLSSDTIKLLQNVFANYHKVNKAIIYGSRAKGNFRTGSDIDLVITGTDLNLQDILSLKVQIEELDLPYAVDLSILDEVSNPDLVDHIHRVGAIFYQRS